MAKTVVDNQQVVRPEWQEWVRYIGFGAVVGLVYWLILIILNRYVVEPLACRTVVDAASCVAAPVLAGKLSTIMTIFIALIGMVRLSMARPIIVAVAAGILLWNLSAWTLGLFWLEAFAWSLILYAVVYGLFGWVVRRTSILVSSVTSLVLVVALYVALILV